MIERLAKWLTRKPRLVALAAVIMLIPAAIGYISTRINYDILSYLPEDLESSQGEKLLEENGGYQYAHCGKYARRIHQQPHQ